MKPFTQETHLNLLVASTLLAHLLPLGHCFELHSFMSTYPFFVCALPFKSSQVEHLLLMVKIVLQHIPQHLNAKDTNMCYKMLVVLQCLEPLLPPWKVPSHLALVDKMKRGTLCCHLIKCLHKNHRQNLLKEDVIYKGG